MSYRSSKYSAEVNQRLKVAALMSLQDGAKPMTRDDVIAGSPSLSGVTPQKISMVLGELCEMGMAQRHKARNGRTVYWIREEEEV